MRHLHATDGPRTAAGGLEDYLADVPAPARYVTIAFFSEAALGFCKPDPGAKGAVVTVNDKPADEPIGRAREQD